jgi:20S proteasome alpha/beta subunit
MGRGEPRVPLAFLSILVDRDLVPSNRIRFLAYVDLLGVTYSASTLATGYGAYIAQPLLRKAVEGKEDTLTEAEARTILEDALRVLFYRDARSINQVLCYLPTLHTDPAQACFP